MREPIAHSSKAFVILTRRGRKKEEPESGTSPMLIKTSMSVASSEATIISQANTSEHPAPAATPLSLQMIGLGRLRIARMIGLYLFCSESRKDLLPEFAEAFRSWP